MELFAEVVNKLGGYLWHCIENKKARVALLGESLGEQVVCHLGTHATQANETDAICTRAGRMTEKVSGRPHE
jgi:hypothetical protein